MQTCTSTTVPSIICVTRIKNNGNIYFTVYFTIHNANMSWENSTIHITMYLYLLFLPII